MAVPDEIIKRLDELILAKLNGVSDISALFDQTLGALGVSPASSLRQLMELRERYVAIASAEDGGIEIRTIPIL